MASSWFTRKAFCYFGGAFIILLGGAIVVLAPYNYIGYVANSSDSGPFYISDRSGFYPQLEIAVSVSPENSTDIQIDILVYNNETMETNWVNFSLGPENSVSSGDYEKYESRIVLDVNYGNHTVAVMNMEGAGWFDLSLRQISDSRLYIVVGGSMNIIGLIMGAVGYCLPGAMIPSGNEVIVDWGFEDDEEYEYE
ncbi:MAG: hypothetical protein GF411_00250 [Candidatus Lokiarchaeota archaeon]|nr:hypothetical protein [Candidatus Lokiarchaeota archaeon]